MESNLFAKFVKLVNKKSNNKGSSVVLVLVVIAFVGMLVSMSSFMSYYNWMGKYNDKQSKINFYSAEAGLAEINAGLQNVVSNAMTISYSYALQNSTGDDMNTRKHKFEIMYEKQLVEQLKGSASDRYDVDILKGYLKKTKYNPATATGTQILTSNNDADNENILFKKNGGIILQNVKLMHTDQKGYVTYLTTDIFLQLPNVNLAATVGVPELENCSIIANNNLFIKNNNNIKISGNVYGGKEGMVASGDTILSFVKKDTDSDSTMYHVIADSLTVEDTGKTNRFSISENYDFWAESVWVKSARVSLLGSSFIRDDLTVEGRDSSVTLGGSYYGYGDELYKSQNSSAILINGGNTTLDFSQLNNLMLSGHAYIGARHYDANSTDVEDYVVDPDAEEEEEEESTTPKTYAKNDKDLMMGESLGVKSNQLIYMVPVECMGYYAGTSKQYLAKNPISYAEYVNLTTSYQYEYNEDGTIKTETGTNNPVFKLDANGNKMLQYDEVNLGIIANKVGKTLNSLGATYKPVFRKINGSVLVYYYLDFTSEKAANDFFEAYYKADKQNMDDYIKMYVKDLKLNSGLEQANSNLHIAGNMIKFKDDGEIDLVDDTLEKDIEVEDTLKKNREKWYDTFTAYSKKMLSNTSLLTNEQLSSDIYTNLVVDDYDFSAIVSSGTHKYFENGNVKALAINNKNGSAVTLGNGGLDLTDVAFVIASGDVVLNANYKGLLISGGIVEVGPLCNRVENDAITARKAIAATNGTVRVSGLLRDGDAYITKTSAASISVSNNDLENKIDRDEDYIKLAELITYENWTKR